MSGPLRGNLLSVRVTPKASRNEIAGLHAAADGVVSLSVRVTATPDKGRANRAVIALLAKNTHASKSTFTLVKGETDRNKTFQISGTTEPLEALIASFTNTGSKDGRDH